MSGIIRVSLALAFFLTFNTSGKTYAQEVIGECDSQSQEAVCDDETLIKGTPSPETVAGHEEIVTPPTPQPEVLGESTATLADTGIRSTATNALGLLIITIVIILHKRVYSKYSIRK